MISFLIPVLTLALLSLLCGWLLGLAARWFRVPEQPDVSQIDALLPQTQCGQCGYPGCRPYAEAICQQQEKITLCAPGGPAVARQIAAQLNLPDTALNIDALAEPSPVAQTAVIDEAWCVGCTRCIQVCPVDAIIGSNRLMHTVIEDACTGCELCLPACPMDCIALRPVHPALPAARWQDQRRADPIREPAADV